MAILSVQQVAKRFGKDSEHTVAALRGINLEIEKGTFTAMMGTSGSGKSTLLNLLSGLDHPTEGEIFLKGESISCFDDKKRTELRNKHLGFIFQFFHLIPVLNVLDNVTLPLMFSKGSVEGLENKAMELLEKLEIDHLAQSYPSKLSGGQQQRVAIARALINDPDIILADEPTGSLDSNTSRLVMEHLQRLSHSLKHTLILVTHDASVAAYAQRVLFMHDGQMVEDLSICDTIPHKEKTQKLLTVAQGINR